MSQLIFKLRSDNRNTISPLLAYNLIMKGAGVHPLLPARKTTKAEWRLSMAFTIEEEFEVQAPVQKVWDFLIDPAKVVVCIPGAALLEAQDEGSFLGAVKVKVGPVTMSYKGTVKFTEVDEQIHQVRLVGEGREASGGGSVKVSMMSRVTALPTGSSKVVVSSEVDLVGKIVQFGRGMIQEVSKQLFRQFSACAKQRLEIPDEPQIAAPQPAESQPAESQLAESQLAESQSAESQSAETRPDKPRMEEKAPPPEPKPVNAVALGLQALWSVIARFFLRLFEK